MDTYDNQTPSEELATARFVILYRMHFRRMQRVADQILHDWSLAEDVAQDAFMRVLLNAEQIPDPAQETCRALLIHITRNIAIDYYRKRKRTPEVSYDEWMPGIPDTADGTESLWLDSRTTVIDQILSAQMDSKQESLLILKYGCDMPDKAIAAALQISNDAVRTRLVRARKQMKAILLQGD